jgi:hypothetical protein
MRKSLPVPDPVILQMRLSHVRRLIEILSGMHSKFSPNHKGWAHCDCDLAQLLRGYSTAIGRHLKLDLGDKEPMHTLYQAEEKRP